MNAPVVGGSDGAARRKTASLFVSNASAVRLPLFDAPCAFSCAMLSVRGVKRAAAAADIAVIGIKLIDAHAVQR